LAQGGLYIELCRESTTHTHAPIKLIALTPEKLNNTALHTFNKRTQNNTHTYFFNANNRQIQWLCHRVTEAGIVPPVPPLLLVSLALHPSLLVPQFMESLVGQIMSRDNSHHNSGVLYDWEVP
jgi:hypothetical protein